MPGGKLVIGLVGQVCAGKSTVAEAFRRQGAKVYEADRHVHEIYRRPEIIKQVRELFGDAVIDAQGNVDRGAVGKIVFAHPKKLAQLTEKIVFPHTGEAMEQALKEFKSSNSVALVLDAPTLFEAGRQNLCERIIYVTAPKERRKEWAKSRGWSLEELERRQSRLQSEEEKIKRADAVIENGGSLEELERQVASLLEKWSTSGGKN